MRTFEVPYLADWVVTSLRWLLLMVITVAMAQADNLTLTNLALLTVAAAWNLFATMLAILYRRLQFHRQISLLIDILITFAFFAFNGGINGPLIWIGLFAIATASVFYEWRGSLVLLIVISLTQSGWAFLKAGPKFDWISLEPTLGFNILAGIITTIISTFLMRRLRTSYQSTVEVRKETERKVQLAERTRMQTLYQMVETMSATLNYKIVIDAILDLSTNALGGEESPAGKLVSAVLLFGDRDLNVVSARHFTSRDLQLTFPAEKGVLQEVLHSADAKVIKDPANDPELTKIITMEACKSALILPLRRGANAYGMMLFAHPDPDFFTPDQIELLEMISHQAVISIQNARLYEELEQEKERIIQTQEEARKKLARDLHDGPIQSVSAIVMRADVAGHLLEQEPQQVAEELAKIEDLARRSTKELRHLLFTLRPLALESEGLSQALQAMAEKMRDTYQQNVQIEIDQAVTNQLEMGKQNVVFYLCEEAVNNARKHAKATLIMVSLEYFVQQPEMALLEIIDNGVGFNVKEVLGDYEKRGSLGMVNLQERADLINGLLNIDSLPGKGTRVRVLIPLSEKAADLLQRGKVIR
ncbi:MAG TPA: GAF domain-containing sensor histidine kinase [Anaerolineaceae bacterium]